MADPMAPPPVLDARPIPAASLILVDDEAGPLRVLMTARAGHLAFAPGASVFPGGRVDGADHDYAARHAGDDHAASDGDMRAAMIAAVRETIEEVGLAAGLAGPPDAMTPQRIRQLRDATAQDGFAAAIVAAGLSLDWRALIPFARWLPNHKLARVFDTRFFIVHMPGLAARPLPPVDAAECAYAEWVGPRALLDMADAGTRDIIFPTRRNLERLAQFSTFAALADHARQTPVRTITPTIELVGGEKYLSIPDDLGYPVTREPLATTPRG